jgi:hypothetical protein
MSRDRRSIALDLVLAVLLVVAVAVVVVVVVGSRPASRSQDPPDLDLPPAPDLDVGSTMVTSEIAEDDTVHVTTWVRSPGAVDSVRVAAPPDDVEVRDLVVAGDGRAAVTGGSAPTRAQEVVLDRPSRLVYVSYDLVGAVDRFGSVPGRALASPMFVAARVEDVAGPVQVAVSGQQILNAVCVSGRASKATRPCGEPDRTGWQVELSAPHRNDTVAVQLDLATRATGAAEPGSSR